MHVLATNYGDSLGGRVHVDISNCTRNIFFVFVRRPLKKSVTETGKANIALIYYRGTDISRMPRKMLGNLIENYKKIDVLCSGIL